MNISSKLRLLCALVVQPAGACGDGAVQRTLDASVAVVDGPAATMGDAQISIDAGDGVENGGSVCRPQVSSFAILSSPHLLPSEYDPKVYNSNPPSSGPHCAAWGSYATFAQKPLPRCNYIHNLEHGAVVFLHHCPGGCLEITAAFEQLVGGFNHDVVCPRPRLIITADADLPSKVAATAWGATFTADCLDAPALELLERFARERYNRAPENVCVSGGVAP